MDFLTLESKYVFFNFDRRPSEGVSIRRLSLRVAMGFHVVTSFGLSLSVFSKFNVFCSYNFVD